MGGVGDGMTDQRNADFLAIVIENAELRQQLADVQDQCVELAVDAGELHAEIDMLRARLVQTEKDRVAWCAEAERSRRTLFQDHTPADPLNQPDPKPAGQVTTKRSRGEAAAWYLERQGAPA